MSMLVSHGKYADSIVTEESTNGGTHHGSHMWCDVLACIFIRRIVWRVIFFFFSSRRRHTIFDCDWSSDVCSSDLREPTSRSLGRGRWTPHHARHRGWPAESSSDRELRPRLRSRRARAHRVEPAHEPVETLRAWFPERPQPKFRKMNPSSQRRRPSSAITQQTSLPSIRWRPHLRAVPRVRPFGSGFASVPLDEPRPRLRRTRQRLRKDERRVGKECRSRWSPYH